MRNAFLLVAAMVLLMFTACQNDEFEKNGSGMTSVSFTAKLPKGDTPSTRTAGDGTQVNRCILEVYLGGELYLREVQPVSNLAATFNIRLVTSQTYDFVFWADHVASVEGEAIQTDLHYTTDTEDGLQAIAFKGDYQGSSKADTRDAFFAKKTVTVTNTFSENINLTRPFGQLNIKTDDIADIQSADLKPAKVNLAFKQVYTQFDALQEKVIGDAADITYKADAEVVDAEGNLSIDYLFAPAGSGFTVDMTLTAFNAANAEITDKEITGVPIQRNYKTNVSGKLLTAAGKLNIAVTPAFAQPDISHAVVEVESVADVATALTTNTNVVVATAPTADATITLPKYTAADVAVTVTLPATEQKVTFEVASEGDSNPPAALTINTPSISNLVITAPATTVTLNGTTYTAVEATTADNTLVVESGVTIGTLTLKQGSVKLYGKVNAITKDTGYTGEIIRCLDNQQSYDNLIADNVSGYTSILIEREATFKGDPKTQTVGKKMKIAANANISGLKIHTTEVEADNLNPALASPIEIVDGAANVIFDNLIVSSVNKTPLVKIIGTNQKVTIRNSSLMLTTGKANQSGINIQNGGTNNVITALVEDTYIGFGETKLNVSKDQDYAYTEQKKNAFTGSNGSRAITVGCNTAKTYDGTATTNLTVNGCTFEGMFYVINALHNVSLNVNVNNSILDGRAAFNIWSTSGVGSTFNIKNSKLIGRNCFAGETEVFATVVLNDYNGNDTTTEKNVRNNTITLDNCDVVSDNDPQTDTNYQYGVSLRSAYYNKLVLKNGTKMRETVNPRLLSVVQINSGAWRNEVITDGTVNMEECAAGATVLPSNKWDGYSYTSMSTKVADDGKIYLGDPSMLAGLISTGGDVKGKEIVLARDLDMNNKNLAVNASYPGISKCIFNGNNHTIANYKMENKMYAALLPRVITVTIKNLTLKNATIKSLNDGRNNAYAGGFIGCGYGTNVVENCTLENSTVQGINKVGGIVGFQAENDVTIKNCTVKGSKVKVDTSNTEYGQCGGIVGYIGSAGASCAHELSGNSIINTQVEAPANTNEGEEHRRSSICVGSLHGVNGQSLVINMPADKIKGSTFNGKAVDTSNYQGLLGGIRNAETTTTVTINGTTYK